MTILPAGDKPPTSATEAIISALVDQMRAPRGSKMIHAGGRAMHVRTPGARRVRLSNGMVCNITTDDSGIATQIDDGDHLHAIVRPKPYVLKLRGVH